VNSASLDPYGFREEFSPHPINLIREILAKTQAFVREVTAIVLCVLFVNSV